MYVMGIAVFDADMVSFFSLPLSLPPFSHRTSIWSVHAAKHYENNCTVQRAAYFKFSDQKVEKMNEQQILIDIQLYQYFAWSTSLRVKGALMSSRIIIPWMSIWG